jgi:hypothetical protein
MLLAFRVANFRSLRDEQELSMVATAGGNAAERPTAQSGARAASAPAPAPAADTAPDRAPEPGQSAGGRQGGRISRPVPVAAIYGANAAGKSNVLDALIFMREVVLASYGWAPDAPIPVDAFLLDAQTVGAPSSFEVDLLLGGVRFQYGFRLDSERVRQEWLYSYPAGRRRVLFERDAAADAEFRFGKSLAGHNRAIADLTRPNALYLSTAAGNNHRQLGAPYRWFASGLVLASPKNRGARTRTTADGVRDEPFRDRVLTFLRAADLGITELVVRDDPLGDLPIVRGRSGDFTVRRWHVVQPVERRRLIPIAGVSDALGPLDSVTDSDTTIEFRHGGDRGTRGIPLSAESLGTQAWFALAAPLLRALDRGDTLLVDELDASLHPALSVRVVEMIQDPAVNRTGAQLIFTTHDTSLLGRLLDDHCLAREQVWFTEKDRSGATELYPLSDFSPRRAENLERGYLQGRYGAVPFVDDRLLRDAVMTTSPVTTMSPAGTTEADARDPGTPFPESGTHPPAPAAGTEEAVPDLL